MALQRPLALSLALAAALAACSGEDDPAPDPCASPPGPGWLAYASRRAGNYDVRLVSPDGACDRAITDDPNDDLSPSFSLAASAVAFAGIRDGRQVVVVHDLASGTERVLDTGGLAAVNPAVSPDGTTVAFEGRLAGQDPPAKPDVYLVPLAGGAAPVAVAPSAAADAGPAWGDGATVYFVSDRLAAGNFQVYRVKTDGSALEPLTAPADARPVGTGIILGKAAVSPNGLEIAFARSASPLSRVVVRTLATGAERLLSAYDDSEPAFDPAGGGIAVSSYEFGDSDILVRSLSDGALLRRVTASPLADGGPAFAR